MISMLQNKTGVCTERAIVFIWRNIIKYNYGFVYSPYRSHLVIQLIQFKNYSSIYTLLISNVYGLVGLDYRQKNARAHQGLNLLFHNKEVTTPIDYPTLKYIRLIKSN